MMLRLPTTTQHRTLFHNIVKASNPKVTTFAEKSQIFPQYIRSKYTRAITRKVASTLTDALTTCQTSNNIIISVNKANEQHAEYRSTLKSILDRSSSQSSSTTTTGENVIVLPKDDDYPDCVFIEDTAVVVGNHAVINRIGTESRVGEVDPVKDCLVQLGLTVHDMRDEIDTTCDGGDVMYTGRDLFVGLSSRTNEAGFQFLHKVFTKQKECQVNVIPVPLTQLLASDDNAAFLHLKSVVTHIDERTLLLPKSKLGEELFKLMKGKEPYTPIYLPDMASCNVISLNGVVLIQPTQCEETRMILEKEIVEKRGLEIVYVNNDEFAKCDGALTCKSLLLEV